MSKTSSSLASHTFHWEPKYPFDLVVGYEDTQTRGRAMILYDRLAHRLEDDYDFQCTWWKFDHLENASLMAQAIDAAIEANMVILSFRGDVDLSATTRDWLEAWAFEKAPDKSALVVLMDMLAEATAVSRSLSVYLQQLARRARMDYFLHQAHPDADEFLDNIESLGERARTVTPVLQGILHKTSSPRFPWCYPPETG